MKTNTDITTDNNIIKVISELMEIETLENKNFSEKVSKSILFFLKNLIKFFLF